MLDVTRAYGLNMLFPINDKTVGRMLRDHGEFSKVEAEIISEYLALTSAGALIDVGANIGSVCLPVASQFPDREVIAIEGHAGLAQILGTNAFSNGLYNVSAMHAVAGPEEKLASFPSVALTAAGNFGKLGMHQVGAGNRETNVRMCTLDEIAPADTAFIKVDVEGFEPEVLAGATRLLEQTGPVWLLETGRKFEAASRQTISVMLAAGYDVYWLFVPFVTFTAAKGWTGTEMSGDVNILAVPKGGPNLWDLAPVLSADDPRPNSLEQMPYLQRFGFSHPSWSK